MNHLSDEQLILHYYGEDTQSTAVDRHLTVCSECRACYQKLVLILNAVSTAPAAERSAAYGAEVWRRLQPSLVVSPRRRVGVLHFPRRSWMATGAIAAMLLLAFLAGRFLHKPDRPEVVAIPGAVRERILLAAVEHHFERSQMVLAELANANPSGTLDISSEQERARELLSENRLYRQTAASAGESAVAGVLDELERVLLEIAHSPSRLSTPDLEKIRDRIESEGIIFKVRVIGSKVKQQEKAPIRESL
jgi:hypothetical protein